MIPGEQLDLDLAPDLPFGVVMSQSLDGRGFAVVLRQEASYAACVVRPASGLVIAPNHEEGMDGFVLCAPLSEPGLAEVLDWTERRAALQRYARLIDAATPGERVTRLLDHILVETVGG